MNKNDRDNLRRVSLAAEDGWDIIHVGITPETVVKLLDDYEILLAANKRVISGLQDYGSGDDLTPMLRDLRGSIKATGGS